MRITCRIQRYHPETDAVPHFQDYSVEAAPTDRVLDVLMLIKQTQDPTLAVRKSCGHGVCGSDAMVINGEERLACKTLVQDVAKAEGATITLEPLRALPVQCDLYVDQAAFFAKYRSVRPYLIRKDANEERSAGREYVQTPESHQKFADATKCILCAACYSSCPVVNAAGNDFIGPAAVLQAARFVFDDRDQGLKDRLPVLDAPDGAWACKNHFNCTRVCPRGIKVTKAINLTKRLIERAKESPHQDP